MTMSKRINRARFNRAQTGREYRIFLLREIYPPYWDEGINLYPRWRRGFINPNKQIYPSKVREYRTWKYNRKTRWK